MSKQQAIRYLAGIDGGGTSCRARICDLDGKVLGEGKTGSANLLLGVEAAMQAITAAIGQAAAEAGLTEDDYAAMSVGLAVAAAEHEPSWQAFMALPHPFAHITLNTDAYGACLGAFGGEDGAIVIAGTGSVGLMIKGDEQLVVGGLGFPISDQGSGATMGLHLIQQTLLVRDRILPPSEMAELVLAHFNHDVDQLVSWMKQARPADYGQFSPDIFRLAGEDDWLAKDLLRQTAADIEMWMQALCLRGAEKICLMGSIGERIQPWMSLAMLERVAEPQGDAMAGALAMARRGNCDLYQRPTVETAAETGTAAEQPELKRVAG